MNHIERRGREMLYISDESVMAEQKIVRKLVQEFNTMDRSDFDGLAAQIKKILGKSENAFINPPFYCDYGNRIGDNCQCAPNVAIYTAGHPVHPATRNTLYEYGIDVTIGNNVWIGGNVVICPGVTIGDNVVIGAGSVVTKDIPAWSVAAGNPCKVIRKITEADRYTYYKGVPADEEAVADMQRMWAENTDPVKYPTADE